MSVGMFVAILSWGWECRDSSLIITLINTHQYQWWKSHFFSWILFVCCGNVCADIHTDTHKERESLWTVTSNFDRLVWEKTLCTYCDLWQPPQVGGRAALVIFMLTFQIRLCLQICKALHKRVFSSIWFIWSGCKHPSIKFESLPSKLSSHWLIKISQSRSTELNHIPDGFSDFSTIGSRCENCAK